MIHRWFVTASWYLLIVSIYIVEGKKRSTCTATTSAFATDHRLTQASQSFGRSRSPVHANAIPGSPNIKGTIKSPRSNDQAAGRVNAMQPRRKAKGPHSQTLCLFPVARNKHSLYKVTLYLYKHLLGRNSLCQLDIMFLVRVPTKACAWHTPSIVLEFLLIHAIWQEQTEVAWSNVLQTLDIVRSYISGAGQIFWVMASSIESKFTMNICVEWRWLPFWLHESDHFMAIIGYVMTSKQSNKNVFPQFILASNRSTELNMMMPSVYKETCLEWQL